MRETEDTNMLNWKSKTFWTGIAAIAGGVGLVVSGDINEGIAAIWAGIALITTREAIRKAEK